MKISNPLNRTRPSLPSLSHILPCMIVVLFSFASLTQAQTIYYNFGVADGITEVTSNTIPLISASQVSGGNATRGTSSVNASSGYTGASGDYNYFLNTTTGGALDISTSSYFTFTLTPSTGYQVRLDTISFGARVSNVASSPSGFSIHTNLDGFATSIASGSFTKGTAWLLYTPALSSAISNLDSPLTVRVYVFGSNGETNAGGMRFDDLTIGATALVPEPSTLGILLLAAGGCFIWMRTRKRNSVIA